MRIITGATEKSNTAKLSLETSISSVTERRDMAMLLMYLNYFHVQTEMLPFMRLETFRRSFIPYALKLWNLLSILCVRIQNLSFRDLQY